MLTDTLLKIAAILDNHSIPYMVIGGYAVLYHGQARFTEDIDIVLGVDSDELEDVIKATSDDFKPRPEDIFEFVNQTNVLPLIDTNTEVRVDLIFSFLEFERKAIERSLTAFVEEKKVQIVHADDLIIYKIIAGRARDLDDIKSILYQKKETLDLKEITSNIKQLAELMDNPQLVKNWKKILDEI